MTVSIKEIHSKKELQAFINLSWRLYRGDRNWVPPLKSDMMNSLLGKNDPPELNGSRTFFIAYRDRRAAGRLCVGINQDRNDKKQRHEGYISLFECIDDDTVACALFERAASWLRERGMDSIKGPMSPSSADDLRGLLVKGFDGPPVFMNSYNPPYYQRYQPGHRRRSTWRTGSGRGR